MKKSYSENSFLGRSDFKTVMEISSLSINEVDNEQLGSKHFYHFSPVPPLMGWAGHGDGAPTLPSTISRPMASTLGLLIPRRTPFLEEVRNSRVMFKSSRTL